MLFLLSAFMSQLQGLHMSLFLVPQGLPCIYGPMNPHLPAMMKKMTLTRLGMC